MKINNVHYRSVWVNKENPSVIQVIDQRHLPHRLMIEALKTSAAVCVAIKDMHVRGAPLIGAAAAYGMYLAAFEAKSSADFNGYLQQAGARLQSARPTAVNLKWAVQTMLGAIQKGHSSEEKIQIAFQAANQIADEDISICRKIGEHGLGLIQEVAGRKKGKPVNILTHCNAGWLACVDWGTASAPVFMAHDSGIAVHVWVDETRPRNQGASLTAWEYAEHGVPHTVIVDNAGGHLMQHGEVDLVIVGTDRTTRCGDVANKIGTYLKALAAKDNGIPFYVAAPSRSIDWEMQDGIKEIPIEERSADEIHYLSGLCDGEIKNVRLTPEKSAAVNFAFDVTPARLVSGIITERGIAEANEESLLRMFPEKMLSGHDR